MRHYYFRVTFVTSEWHIVKTGSKREAKILAQALEIQSGNDYSVESVEKLSDKDGE